MNRRDSTVASVWRDLNRFAFRIAAFAGFIAAAANLVLAWYGGQATLVVTAAAAAIFGAVGAYGVRTGRDDADLVIVTACVAAVTISAFSSPLVRGGLMTGIAVLTVIGALLVPADRRRRFLTIMAGGILAQTLWPVLGLATLTDSLANVTLSGGIALGGSWIVLIARKTLEDAERSRIEIFRSVPVGLFRAGPGGQLIDANPALATMLRCESHHDLIGYNVAGLYETPGEWTQLADQLEAGDHPVRFAHRMVRRDGEVIWVRGFAQAIRSEGGDVVYYEGAVEDVTQRRETEEASHRHAERFRNVFERAPIAIWEEDFTAVGSRLDELRDAGVKDLRAYLLDNPEELVFLVDLIRFVDVNPAGVALLGASSKEEALDVVIPVDAPAAVVEGFIEEFIAVWEDRDQLMIEVKGATATGGETDLALSWAIGRLPNGDLDLSRAVVAIQDIAIIKQAERDLAALIESKDELIASVSHELRTPITTILGLSFELRDHGEQFTSDELSEFVSMIADQSRELANIVEDLLVAARTEAGTLTVRSGPTDITTEIGYITAIEPKEVEAKASGPVVAWADPLRLRQILRNLLSNAERYGGTNVEIEVEHHNRFVVVRVRDDGPGVPPDQKESIFEPYVRGGGDTALPGSLGLGLAVSRRLARLMGGDLTYRWDGSSIFELTLPTERPAA